MSPPPNVSTPAGTTQAMKVAGGITSTCNIDESVVRPLLDKPARNLTLWEAAHVVALLHLQGRIKLRGTPYPEFPKPPLFKGGCKELHYPGPNPLASGRFTVNLEEAFFLPGGRRIDFEYLKAYPSKDEKGNPIPIKSFVQVWGFLDVRLVVLLHHLMSAYEKLEKRGIKVKKVIHLGMAQVQGSRFESGKAKDAEKKVTGFPRMLLCDNHMNGRAIDFVGVVLEDGEVFTVLQDWAEVELPGGIRAVGAPQPDRWPVYDSVKNSSNWADVSWASNGRSDENSRAKLEANRAGRTDFHSTFYRLHARLPKNDGPATTRDERAAVIFLETFEAFVAHATLDQAKASEAPASDDFPARGAMGTSATDLARRDHGSLLHPETPNDPVLRETHRDHMHAQVGHTGHEFPDDDNKQADARVAAKFTLPEPATNPVTKRAEVWQQPGGSVTRKNKQLSGAVTPPAPSKPTP